MLTFIAILALSVQQVAPYLIWRNRWNIPTHMAGGICIAAYILPGLFTDVWVQFPESTIFSFMIINVVGATFLCLGIYAGNYIGYTNPLKSYSIWSASSSERLTKRVIFVASASIIGMYISYYIMGFVPLFADDPMSARQFKGVYRDLYYRAAYPYRFSFSILNSAIPIILAIAWIRRTRAAYFLAGLALVALLVSLSRTAAAAGVLFFIGILAARTRRGTRWYIPLVFVVYPFGSLFFLFLGQILNVSQLQDVYIGESIVEYVSSGAPDISDQLKWFDGFVQGEYFSYGRTFFGGLIPGNYHWNPSVWTLTYDNIGADVSEIVSGGLRLTPAEWGYANFGWLGVVVLPFLSGMINGFIIHRLKNAIPQMPILQVIAALILYATLGQQLVQFYILSIHSLPAIAAALFFWHSNKNEHNVPKVISLNRGVRSVELLANPRAPKADGDTQQRAGS